MSISRKQAKPKATYGAEALRLYRAAQGAGSEPTETTARESESPGTTTVDPPAPLPIGVGFAVVAPLHTDTIARPSPHSEKNALTIVPEWIPASFAQSAPGRVVFWYALADSLHAEADWIAATGTMWRVYRCLRMTAASLGWALPDQEMRLQATPVDTTSFVAQGSSMRTYTLADLTRLLDQAEIPTREEEERQAAEWAAKFHSPDLRLDAGDLIINPDAVLPAELLHPLLEKDAVFQDTWRRLRSDLPNRNEAYDQELTRILADHKCDAQTIVNAIIHFRRMHGRNPDLRVRYFRQLLSKEWRDKAEPLTGSPQQRSIRRERRQVCVAANDTEQVVLEELARREGQSLSNLVRLKFGMPPIYPGRPDAVQEIRREDWVCDRLQELGIDHKPYFPDG